MQGDVSRDEDCRKIVAAAAPVGTSRRADQQCRDHQACGARKPGRVVGGRFPAAVRRQHHWPVPDGAGGEVAAGSGCEGVGTRVGGRQHIVGCPHQRHRLFGRLCREQGRAEHHDLFAGARAGAADPRQHRLSRAISIRRGSPRAAARPAPAGARYCRGEGAAQTCFVRPTISQLWCAFWRRRHRAT